MYGASAFECQDNLPESVSSAGVLDCISLFYFFLFFIFFFTVYFVIIYHYYCCCCFFNKILLKKKLMNQSRLPKRMDLFSNKRISLFN